MAKSREEGMAEALPSIDIPLDSAWVPVATIRETEPRRMHPRNTCIQETGEHLGKRWRPDKLLRPEVNAKLRRKIHPLVAPSWFWMGTSETLW